MFTKRYLTKWFGGGVFAENHVLKEDFVSDCIKFELLCEISSLTLCKRTVDWLWDQKKRGCALICVSDMHLRSTEIKELFFRLGISALFDDVISSCDRGIARTKHEGSLYPYVLEKLGLRAVDCLMIGDNLEVDCKVPRKFGIASKWVPHEFHKVFLSIGRRAGRRSLKDRAPMFYAKPLLNSNNYREYALFYYAFCERLYEETRSEKLDKIVFLAREGHFLKRCFNLYQSLVIPREERIETCYLKCSRRAAASVQREKCEPSGFSNISIRNYMRSIGFLGDEVEAIFGSENDLDAIWPNLGDKKVLETLGDSRVTEIINLRYEENRLAFDNYLNNVIGTQARRIAVVDIGWTGRMQSCINSFVDSLELKGFYLGVIGDCEDTRGLSRKGLLFDCGADAAKQEKSAFYDVFRANTQLFEQLAAAPHGSACFYRMNQGKAKVVEEWERSEQSLYFDTIQDLQTKLLNDFSNICVMNFRRASDATFNKELALVKCRSDLIQNRGRVDFMDELCNGFVQNFRQQTTGIGYESTVQIPITKLIGHPEEYERYFAKLGLLAKKKKCFWLSRVVNSVVYAVISLRIKVGLAS